MQFSGEVGHLYSGSCHFDSRLHVYSVWSVCCTCSLCSTILAESFLHLRMAEQMQKILKNMNDSYAALSEVEAEILVDTEGKLLN